MPIAPAHIESKPLRIAMLSIHSSPEGALGTQDTGGMSVYIKSLSQCLGSTGHCIDIFTSVPGGPSTRMMGKNVRLIQLLPSSLAASPAKSQLANNIAPIFHCLENYRCRHNLRYNLIHSHYWISGMVGALAQAQWLCPHVIMFHTLALMKNRLATEKNETPERIRNEGRLARIVQHIIVPVEQERLYLREDYHADPSKISVIPCGVDLDQFDIMDRQMARQHLGISKTARILLYVGRFAPLKGLDQLIEALAFLKPSHPEIELMLVGGDGPFAESSREIMQRAARHDLERSIRLIGRVEHQLLPRYYAAADALVLTSQYESFGLVVLEALACGLPVAATAVGVAGMIIREGHNGILFKSPAAIDIATGLERLLTQIGAQPSREDVRRSVLALGWRRIAERVHQTYNLVLRQYDLDRTTEASITNNC